jgi:hypothetical protein
MIREQIEVKNWLTHGLIDEIQEEFPTAGDLEVRTGVRNKDVFSDRCRMSFPPGHVFTSNKQVEQAAYRFLEAWAVHGVHDEKNIMCHFGVPGKKKRPTLIAPGIKPREILVTKTNEVKCPFCIQYSWVDYTRANKKPTILYHVKITTLHLEHTCQMAPKNTALPFKSLVILKLMLAE